MVASLTQSYSAVCKTLCSTNLLPDPSHPLLKPTFFSQCHICFEQFELFKFILEQIQVCFYMSTNLVTESPPRSNLKYFVLLNSYQPRVTNISTIYQRLLLCVAHCYLLYSLNLLGCLSLTPYQSCHIISLPIQSNFPK